MSIHRTTAAARDRAHTAAEAASGSLAPADEAVNGPRNILAPLLTLDLLGSWTCVAMDWPAAACKQAVALASNARFFASQRL
jgi:hypothetical protein